MTLVPGGGLPPDGPVPHRDADAESFLRGGGEAGALIRAFDWSTTCLGDIAAWPQSLRTTVSTMLRSPFPIVLLWGRDLLMFYNDAFRPILGEKHPASIGAPVHLALAEAWDFLGPLIARTLATGEPHYEENRVVVIARRRGGLNEEAYFTWSFNPTVGEGGEVAGIFTLAYETTRQVIGDRRLHTLRELSLRSALDPDVDRLYRSLEDVIARASADLPFALLYVVEAERARLVTCAGVQRGSPAAPVEFGLDEASPWPVGDVARRGDEALVEDLANVVGPLPGGPWPEPSTRALLLPVATGERGGSAVLVAGLSPWLEFDDVYRSFLQLLARQISASVTSARAFEHERRRVAELAELDRAKTAFFSNVSHELRTPLTLVLGPVEDALARPGRALAGEQLEVVRRSAQRLFKMVNTLLDFSRAEAGRAQASFAPTDLAALTVSVAGQFRSAIEAAGLALDVRCAPQPGAVLVDAEMWEKIVLNLLSNALKYTLRGSVRVDLAWTDRDAVLTVEDSGVGIAPSELPRIFERFYRAETTQGRSHEGTGIGLALVHDLVQMHGGDVTARSTLGEGTTFTVRLPRITTTAAAIDDAPTGSALAEQFVGEALRWTPQDAEPVAMVRDRAAARILVVDDNADLRNYVAGLLGRSFAHVETATHGAEALASARALPPDLILCDVMMPVMDGFALVRALRADPRTRTVPIILLSARAGAEAAEQGLDSGADDYLVKPFSGRELLARVRSQLEMARIRDEVSQGRARVGEVLRDATARDEFIAMTSHELRTPITALKLQLEVMERTAAAAGRTTERVGVARRQVDRLAALVEAMLDASRIAAGTLTLAPEDLDMTELARSVAARFAADARAAGSTIDVEGAPEPGRWDRSRVEVVLGSLLSNAVKYAPGKPITLRVDGDDQAVRVVVRDAGIGIPAEALNRVFERYERAVPAENYGGLGLGLYLARKIVEAHGGRIGVESVGDGATFTVTLPRTTACASDRDGGSSPRSEVV